MNTCAELSEALSAFVDGEERKDETVAVRAHLERCAGCRGTVRDWAAIDVLATSVLRAPDARAPRAVHRGVRRRFAPTLAAALALILIAGSAVFASFGPLRASPEQKRRAPSKAAPPSTSAREADAEEPARSAPAATTVSGSERPSASEPASEPAREPGQPPYPIKDPGGEPGGPARAVATDEELALSVQAERTVVRAGEPVAVEAALGNTSDHAVTFWAHEESPIDLVLRDDGGNEVYRRSVAEGWADEPAERTLRPGEFVRETITFTAPRRGTYLLVAECPCVRGWPSPEDGEEQSPSPDTRWSEARPYGSLQTSPIRLYVGG